MVIKSVNLETVCGVTSKLPVNSLPEVAFAGKSNVGKSTLINGIMNRKSYARVSSQPGKTQTINYYNINDAFYLVDLPGYGYATANVKVRQKWGEMIERYLNTSEALKAVFLLIDIRHEPSNNDIMMYDWIVQAGFNPIIIATKADKIKRSQLPACPNRAGRRFTTCWTERSWGSCPLKRAEKRTGKRELSRAVNRSNNKEDIMSGRFEGDEALERLKALKRGRIIFALMTIALGVVLLVYSDDVLTMFSQIIGGILIAGGVCGLLGGIFGPRGSYFKWFLIVFAACIGVVGVWIFTNPVDMAALLPRIMGVLIIVSGFFNLLEAVTQAQQGYSRWLISLLIGIATIVGGVYLFMYAFQAASLAVKVAGGLLLFDGISDIWVISRISTKAKKIYQDSAPVDVDADFIEDNGGDEEETGTEQPRRN